ncbi:MAG: hypothetical protein R3290_06190 [Acidimicrobiia bacterium]|nr:hypothetical protein [Acidimicrobiia bacterium]
MVVVARFVDERRARRMKGWLRLCSIPARLRRGDDGRLELSVRRADEVRAVDLLCTIVLGLDPGHLAPTPMRERLREGENLVTGLVFAFAGLVAGLVALVAVPPLLPLGLAVPALAAAGAGAVGVLSGVRRSTGWRTDASRSLPAWASGIAGPTPRRRRAA